MWSFTLFILSFTLTSVVSFTCDVVQRRRPSDHQLAMLIEDENRNKFRFITPGDINKLFGPNTARSNGDSNEEEYDDDDGEEYDPDEDDEEEEEKQNIQSNNIAPAMAASSVAAIKSEEEIELEKTRKFFEDLAEMENAYVDSLIPQSDAQAAVKKAAKQQRGMEADYDYLELDKVVNQDEFIQIRSTLSLTEAPGIVDPPTRITKYDPAAIDARRMDFGVYRRANGYDDNGKKINPGGKKLRQFSKKRDGQKESFYESLRGLGESARAEAGTAQAVLDPPPKRNKDKNNQKNVNAMPGKGKKAVITPGDIENLFKPKSFSGNENDSNSQPDDNQSENPMNAALRAELMEFKSEEGGGIDGKTPAWLKEAERELKRSRMSPSQRKKKNNNKLKAMTNDWRFWAATIASVGFITAFINVYQTTGGFVGSGQGPELII